MKRTLITFNRIIHVGVKNFIRNAWLSIAATAVMVVALTIILMAYILNVTAKNAITELSKNLKVSIYLLDDAPDSGLKKLESDIRATGIIDTVQFVSKEQARQNFTQSFQQDDQLLEGLALAGSDTLPASYEVSVTDLNRMPEIEAIAQRAEFKNVVESVTLGKTDAKKTIDRAAAAQRYIISASIISASIFAVVSVLIIFNTIRMAIFTRGEEIRIMKLIGATPNYIRGPFLVEASLYGIIAGIIANSAVYSLILSVGSKIANQAEFAASYAYFTQTSTVIMMLLGSIVLGAIVGILSSSLAMQKHLKLRHW